MGPTPAIETDSIFLHRKKCQQAGFTLIEIAVVMVIISMVLVLVIPRLPTSDQENLKISARTLASTLRYMQEKAATSRTGFYLNLAPGTDSVKISEVGGDGGAKEPTDPLLQKSPVKEGIIVADVRIPRLGKINDGQLRVDVGVAGVRDFVTIHLRSAEGKFQTVMAFPSGGKVKVYEGYLEDPP
jgi:general secretion pathway protein H